MTIFYPDVSNYQAGVSFSGCSIAMVKATESTDYTNPDYADAKKRAASSGSYFCAYHFLREGNGAAQAKYAYSVVGPDVPLMLDVEQEKLSATDTSNPTAADALDFVNEYRALGGTCYLLYLPHWYWSGVIGSPSLASLVDLGMYLVTSDYTSYSDTGPGWAGYGGMSVLVWQYSDSGTLNGQSDVDWNAFKGTLVDFKAYVTTGAASGSEPTLQEGDTGAAVKTLQTRLNVWGAKLTVDGDFGPSTLTAVEAFQTKEKLTVDGVVGPATWAALDKDPAPVLVAYPAPTGLAAKTLDLHISWSAVKIPSPDPDAGQAVASYTVEAQGMNGEVYARETSSTTSAVLTGLVPGWKYKILVWCNGGPDSPPSESIQITI